MHGYPSPFCELDQFWPEASERLALPDETPAALKAEFREAERCLDTGARRAASALFRSVLEKTLRASGYMDRSNLKQKIESAGEDGLLPAPLENRAHEGRELGNDVLHDDWREVSQEEVEAAHRYAQRILEAFYDDRAAALEVLRKAGRTADEDRTP